LHRWPFPIRAAEPDEKWARVGSHDGSKYRPVMVPYAGFW
jgi:hypothetical protein